LPLYVVEFIEDGVANFDIAKCILDTCIKQENDKFIQEKIIDRAIALMSRSAEAFAKAFLLPFMVVVHPVLTSQSSLSLPKNILDKIRSVVTKIETSAGKDFGHYPVRKALTDILEEIESFYKSGGNINAASAIKSIKDFLLSSYRELRYENIENLVNNFESSISPLIMNEQMLNFPANVKDIITSLLTEIMMLDPVRLILLIHYLSGASVIGFYTAGRDKEASEYMSNIRQHIGDILNELEKLRDLSLKLRENNQFMDILESFIQFIKSSEEYK